MIAKEEYLSSLKEELARPWPDNRTVNIVCHGPREPSGYTATPYVDSFAAYPHLLHRMIKAAYPYAVANVIVTAIGGEASPSGAARFETEVLCHRPDALTLDYGLNDRHIGLAASKKAWQYMIEASLERGVKVILCTPTWDDSYLAQSEDWVALQKHAEQIRALADEYGVGLADSFKAFEEHISTPADLQSYLVHINHPSEAGHRLVAEAIAKYFL